MAKRRPSDPSRVPCLHVHVPAGKGEPRPTQPPPGSPCRATTAVGFRPTAIGLNRALRATSKSVDAIEGKRCGPQRDQQGKIKRRRDGSILSNPCPPPCHATSARCPVQLVFDRGQPYLRFCVGKNKPGYRVDVDTPEAATRAATKACQHWRKKGSFRGFFPSNHPLKGGR